VVLVAVAVLTVQAVELGQQIKVLLVVMVR
jgi:hypothetical protein